MRAPTRQMPTVTSHARRESGGMARGLSRTSMPPALTSDLALDHLRALSADIRAAVLLDATGERLAGPAQMAAPARELLAALAPGPGELHARTDGGAVFAARDERHQLVVATGPLALPRLTRHDLRTVLRALGGDGPPPIVANAPPPGAVEAVVNAAGGRV